MTTPHQAATGHDSTGLAVVDSQYHWRAIDAATQRGVKLLMINRNVTGVRRGIAHTADVQLRQIVYACLMVKRA